MIRRKETKEDEDDDEEEMLACEAKLTVLVTVNDSNSRLTI